MVEARTKRRTSLAVGMLLLGATGIGFAPIFVKLRETGPAATAFWRVLIAMPILLALAFWTPAPTTRPARPVSRWWLLFPGVFFAGDLTLWHWSLHYTNTANATLLTNFAPIFVCLAGWLWLGERFRWHFPLAALVAIIGAGVLVIDSRDASHARLGGDLLALATAVFYGAYQLSVKRLRARFSAAVIMTFAAAVSSVSFLGAALVMHERLLPVSLDGWRILLGLAIISHIFGQGAIAWALGHLPASFSSISLLWQPVFAGLMGWLLLKEDYGLLQILGGVVILVGIAWARLGSIVDDKPPR